MDSVRLAERYVSAQPGQLSGGLKQRLAIARSFAGNPKLVVCDEPTSALDVSVQAAILNLLVELQAQQQVSYLFISHDLGVVRYVSDRIAVLYLGRLMELGLSETVYEGPHHPYTEALLSAVPTVDGGERPRIKLEGDIPSAADPPTGCVFHTRCPRRIGAICDETEPPLVEVEENHLMRCHIPLDELRAMQAAGRTGRVGGHPRREDPRCRARSDGRATSRSGARSRTARPRRGARASRRLWRLPFRLQRDRRDRRDALPCGTRARGRGRRRGDRAGNDTCRRR